MNSQKNLPHDKNALNIIEQGFPFLKKALFNPINLYKKPWCYNLWEYKAIITKVAPDYSIYHVEDYLAKYVGKVELNQLLLKLRFRVPSILRFLFYKKLTKSSHLIVKILSIPVYRKKVSHQVDLSM